MTNLQTLTNMDSNKTTIPVYIYLPDIPDIKFDVKVCLLPDSVFKEKQQKVKDLEHEKQANDNL